MPSRLADYLWAVKYHGPGGGREGHPRVADKLAVFMRLAADLGGLSTCRRLSVGAVVVPQDLSSVLAIGYNGPPAGADNAACRGVPGGCGCLHAEANALVKLRGEARDLVLMCTDSPCETCAGLVVNCGRVSHVVYDRAYRDRTGVGVLLRAGVVVVGLGETPEVKTPGG